MRPSRARPDGVRLCARYALPTTERRFCGSDRAPEALRALVASGRGRDVAERELRAFEALFPYLETIAAASGTEPFDPEVVEAYWIGNGLLDRDWQEPYRDLLRKLAGRGLPPSVVARLDANLPAGAAPHHTFHVLFVGVGAVTGHVPTTVRNMDRCRTSWGTVEGIADGRLTLRRFPLLEDSDSLRLGSESTIDVAWNPNLLPDVDRGDTVAVHWETAIDRLDEGQRREIARRTNQILDAVNAVRKSS